MSKFWRISVLFLFVAGLCVAGALSAQGSKPAVKKMKTARLLTSEGLKWADVPELPGAKQAVVWGDSTKGAYGMFEKWPAGTEVALHTHTHDNRGAMISGTLVITMEGESAKELGSGSYVFVPGGAPHSTACKAGAECVFYVHQPGPGDLKMLEASGTKK